MIPVGDNLNVPVVVDEIPLTKDAHGVYRIGGTRVTLNLVVRAFNRGATAEEIVQKYDSLRPTDVYQVIGEPDCLLSGVVAEGTSRPPSRAPVTRGEMARRRALR